MVLKIRYEGDDDTETVLLGSREEGVPRRPGGRLPQLTARRGPASARTSGDTREYQLPDGGNMKVTLVSAEPFRA